MKKLILSGLLILCASTIALAQTFTVTGSTPSDGSINVDMQTTISFTFSEAVINNTTSLRNLVGFEPTDLITVDQVRLSTDQKTVHFDVTHTGEGQFLWLLINIPNANGEILDVPYVLNYSTSSNIGSYAVSGTVSYANELGTASVQAIAPNSGMRFGPGIGPDMFQTRLARTMQSVFARSSEKMNRTSMQAKAVNGKQGTVQNAEFNNTIVALSAYNSFEDDGGDTEEISAAGVVNRSDGTYSVNYVTDGTYWPVAYKFGTSDTTFFNAFYIGYYDPQMDGVADSIVVSGGNVTGIDITLFNFRPFLVSEGITRATNWATGAIDDNRLVAFSGTDFGFDIYNYEPADSGEAGPLSGKSWWWEYYYHSESSDRLTMVMVMPFGLTEVAEVSLDDLDLKEDITRMKTIPQNFIDSDRAVQIADTNGGHDFRSGFSSNTFMTVDMLGIHDYLSYEDNPTPSAPVFWHVDYYAQTFDLETFEYVEDSLLITMHIETGEVLSKTTTTDIEEEQVREMPRAVELGQNYPNPFNPTTVIPFTLSKSARVTLTVYNLLGQPVTQLADRVYPAGKHSIRWNAEQLSSGFYLYKLTADGKMLSRQMILMK